MGTGSPVGIPSGKVIAEKTSPGIGDTHCTVNERLDLQILRDMRAEFPYLFE